MTQTGATQREDLDREWLDGFIQRWEAAWTRTSRSSCSS